MFENAYAYAYLAKLKHIKNHCDVNIDIYTKRCVSLPLVLWLASFIIIVVHCTSIEKGGALIIGALGILTIDRLIYGKTTNGKSFKLVEAKWERWPNKKKYQITVFVWLIDAISLGLMLFVGWFLRSPINNFPGLSELSGIG